MAQKKQDEAAAKSVKKAKASTASKKKAADKKAQSKKGKDGKAARPNIFKRFVNYCKSVKIEMQRVVWPTRKELLNASLIVVGALIFFGIFIAIIDNIVGVPLDAIASLNK